MTKQKLHQPPLIHIGFPKSLSTWLQKKLFIDSCGYQTILDPLTAKISFINPLPFRFDEDVAWKFIDSKEINEKLVPVITAENLCGNTLSGGHDAQLNADRLKKAFPEAKILIVIREQINLIRSLYKTQINWGMPYSIEELINRNHPSLVPEFTIEMLKYDGIISYYQKLFGPTSVLVIPYESFLESPEEFCSSIATFSGNTHFDKNKINYKQKINTTRPLVDIYFDRFKNRFNKSPFNYNGIFVDDEERINKRLKLSKKKNRFPSFMSNWFEEAFANKTNCLLAGKFSESNQITQKIANISLEKHGYQL